MDDGCYDARAVNDSGIPIEARYHPVTGELVRARLQRLRDVGTVQRR